MANATEDAYCTLIMSDSYLPGAAVLAHSLRDNGTKKKLAALVTPDSLRPSTITELKSLYDFVIPVERIGNHHPANLYLMNRGDLLYAFTKINVWRQMQFRKIVYLDADIVALRAPDELFDIDASFAGAPDVGWPDAFNTGVMVLTPHMGDYRALKTLANNGDSFDGADQGLLNQYYEHKNWHRLSFMYNCTPSANYQYEPAYRYYKAKISLVHFIGRDKPWNAPRSQHAVPGAYNDLFHRWWSVYDRHFHESTADYATGRYAPASLTGDSVIAEPEANINTTEPDPSEPTDLAEQLAQGLVEPTPTAEQRRFTAPHSEWDATRAAPPADAKPEAANFPTRIYDFNHDKELYRPPKAYPEPPKDMWFEIPRTRPDPAQKPGPIFPWEGREDNRPTRKFADDVVSPVPSPSQETPEKELPPTIPDTPIIKITSDDPWQTYTSGTKNAWDEVLGIDQYVRALNKSRGKPIKAEVTPGTDTQFERRESLLLTDFPSEIDRPSLPVTPAPMHRPTFWSGERDEAGHLPSADGVPNQADWNPQQQLEELRRNSINMPLDLKLPDLRLPDREMPTSAVSSGVDSSGSVIPNQSGGTGSVGPSTRVGPSSGPQFSTLDFAASNPGQQQGEEILSPTEHGSRQFV